MDSKKVAESIAAVSVVAGLLYAMKQKASIGKTALYMAAFGVAGLFIGNAVTKLKKD